MSLPEEQCGGQRCPGQVRSGAGSAQHRSSIHTERKEDSFHLHFPLVGEMFQVCGALGFSHVGYQMASFAYVSQDVFSKSFNNRFIYFLL